MEWSGRNEARPSEDALVLLGPTSSSWKKWVPMKAAACVLALACLISVGNHERIRAQTSAHIVLEEEMSWPVPPTFEPTMISLCPNGNTLLYAPTTRRFIALDNAFAQFADGTLERTTNPLAVIVNPDGRLEAITGSPPSIVLISTDGEVLDQSAIPIRGHLLAATFAPTRGWATLLMSDDHSLTIGIRVPHSKEWTVTAVDDIDILPSSPITITLAKTEVLLTHSRDPHSVHAIDRLTGQVRQLEPPTRTYLKNPLGLVHGIVGG